MTDTSTGGPEPWRSITPDELALVCGIVLAMHLRCDDAIQLLREGSRLSTGVTAARTCAPTWLA